MRTAPTATLNNNVTRSDPTAIRKIRDDVFIGNRADADDPPFKSFYQMRGEQFCQFFKPIDETRTWPADKVIVKWKYIPFLHSSQRFPSTSSGYHFGSDPSPC